MDILKLRRHVTVPFFVFLVSFTVLVLFFSQQSGHVLWENLVGSAVLAAALAFFAFMVTLRRWVILFWLAGTLVFVGLSLWVGGTLSIDYFRSGTSTSSCWVSFYCLNQHLSTWLTLVVNAAFEMLVLMEIIFGFKLGVHTLVALSLVYPQTRYFIGAFLLGLFTLLVGLTQISHDVATLATFQLALLGLFGLFAFASFCFGLFYKKLGTRVDKFKRIYGAAVLAFVPLATLLIPFDVSTAETAKEAFIFRIAFGLVAIFTFVYIGFFAKVRLDTKALNGKATIHRSKNKGARH